MSNGLVAVAMATSRAGADLIVGFLGAHGLEAVVAVDDADGQEPQLQLQGVRVLVASPDEASARRAWPPPRTPPSPAAETPS